MYDIYIYIIYPEIITGYHTTHFSDSQVCEFDEKDRDRPWDREK